MDLEKVPLEKIRNIAIIAHVDHGKTTFVDSMLKQSNKNLENIEERAMDSNAIEKERGITILAKCTAINWKNHLINIIDTPGHSDFGSEVERVLQMVDGVILIVDSVEGVMPQTMFVLRKASEQIRIRNGTPEPIKIIVFVNKIDRASDEEVPKRTWEEIWDKLIALREEYLEVPVFFGSGRSGFCSSDLSIAKGKDNLHEILDAIINEVPHPIVQSAESQMLVTMVAMDKYFGKLLIGRITGGTFHVNQTVHSLSQSSETIESFRITKMFTSLGIDRIPIESASVGQIVFLGGSKISTVNNTIVGNQSVPVVLAPAIEPPTISVTFSTNKSPFKGQEGKKVTINQIKDRLQAEKETNVGITVEFVGDNCVVSGRGELQISVLAETMRREDFEFMLSKPKVIFIEEDGVKKEPIEEVVVIVPASPSTYSGVVSDLMQRRGAVVKSYNMEENTVRLVFQIATRNFLGFGNEFLTATKGEGTYSKNFIGYEKVETTVAQKKNGSIVSMATGVITAYALGELNDRAFCWFVEPGMKVCKGMVIGMHNKQNDLEVNPTKSKELTNVRSVSKDEKLDVLPAQLVTIEFAIIYISSISNAESGDKVEIVVEITPISIRMLVLKM